MESYLESRYLSLWTLAKQSTSKESQNRIPIRLSATLAPLARNDAPLCHCEGLPEAINRVWMPDTVDCRARVARSQWHMESCHVEAKRNNPIGFLCFEILQPQAASEWQNKSFFLSLRALAKQSTVLERPTRLLAAHSNACSQQHMVFACFGQRHRNDKA